MKGREEKSDDGKRRSQKKEDTCERNVGKVANHCCETLQMFFQWFAGREGRKVRSLKPRVRSHLVRWEIKNCTPLWREMHFEVKMVKRKRSRHTFWMLEVEKLHATLARFKSKCTKHIIVKALLGWNVEEWHTAVAQSIFTSQTAKKRRGLGQFWKFRCQKIACCHMSKPKCAKHQRFGALLGVRICPTREIDQLQS